MKRSASVWKKKARQETRGKTQMMNSSFGFLFFFCGHILFPTGWRAWPYELWRPTQPIFYIELVDGWVGLSKSS